MKAKLYTKAALALVLASVLPLSHAQSGVASSNLNPLQIGLLHWYAANLTAQSPVGSHPRSMAFDGQNIWVANLSSNTVSKIRVNDASTIGTYPAGT